MAETAVPLKVVTLLLLVIFSAVVPIAFALGFDIYSKTCVKRPLSKRQKIGIQDQLLLNAGQKYCRMLPSEHSAIPLTFIKLPYVIKIFVLPIFEWPFSYYII